MKRRILFLIRGKLGDSLVLFSAVQRFLARNPDVDAVLALRRDYARLVAADSRAAILPFGSRLELLLRLLAMRLSGRRFDVFAVLWGFGGVTEWMARLSGAKRRIFFDGRRPACFPEWPPAAADEHIVDPAWRVLRLLDAELPRPDRLTLPALAAHRAPRAAAVTVVPVADEARKCLDRESCRQLLAWVRGRHPQAEIRVLMNPRDAGAAAMEGLDLPDNARLVPFGSLAEVIAAYAESVAWYGMDTGLYHLAVAMGLPAWVFFGPTQPAKIVLPAQEGATWVRLAALGAAHCDEKACALPHCLHRAVALLAGVPPATSLGQAPAACPLRACPAASLDRVIHENPHRQA